MDNSSKIYLSREEQIFLMNMLESTDPLDATERFAEIMAEERANPLELQVYLKKIMKAMES